MGLGLDGEVEPVVEGHDAGVVDEGAADPRRPDGVGGGPQVGVQEAVDIAGRGGDAGPEGLVGAVLAPGLGQGLQLGVGGIATLGGEPLLDGHHLVSGQAEAADPADLQQGVVVQLAEGDDPGGERRGPEIGVGRGQVADGPPLDDGVVQHLVGQQLELVVGQEAVDHPPGGHGCRLHRQAELGGRPLQLGGLPVGHPGPEAGLDDGHPAVAAGWQVLVATHPPLLDPVDQEGVDQRLDLAVGEVGPEVGHPVAHDLIDPDAEQLGLLHRSVRTRIGDAGPDDDGEVPSCPHSLQDVGSPGDHGHFPRLFYIL